MSKLTDLIQAGRGVKKADLVIKNSKFLDVFSGNFIAGDIAIANGMIVGTIDNYQAIKTVDAHGAFIVPGFIDAHVHIESSMLTPEQYQNIVLARGTTAVIWDPHEIANIKGLAGINWALQSSHNLTLDVFLMLPSCVPSTNPKLKLETSGAVLLAKDLLAFRDHKRVLGLAEMMNYPGVLNCETDIIRKISQFSQKHIDGHSPLLSGKDLNGYLNGGITADHEASNLKEAKEKLSKGLHILIREGSCAKDADALLPILNDYNSSQIALCSDDRNSLDLTTEGHIDFIINKALKNGRKPENIFRAASFGAVSIYDLKQRGAIAPNYIADFCLVKPNKNHWRDGMQVISVYKNGKLAAKNHKLVETNEHKQFTFPDRNIKLKFPHQELRTEDIAVKAQVKNKQKVIAINIIPHQLLTKKISVKLPVIDKQITADLNQDVIKIAVFERHHATGNYTVGFVKGFNLKHGALAMSINHDTHNVIAIGANDQAFVKAVNHLNKIDGGIVIVNKNGTITDLHLPIGGLMTNAKPQELIKKLKVLNKKIKALGCKLDEPFLQLAFLALPVIPEIRITDRGLVDTSTFKLMTDMTIF